MMWNEIVNANWRRASRTGSKSIVALPGRGLSTQIGGEGTAGNGACLRPDAGTDRAPVPPLCVQRLLDGEKIAPGEALFQWRTQQIRRMERRDRTDLARAGME